MIDKRRAAQICKQSAFTCNRIYNIVAVAPIEVRNVYETLRRQGGKDSQGVIAQLMNAMVVHGKLATVKGNRSLYTLPGDEASVSTRHVPAKIENNLEPAVYDQLQEMKKAIPAAPVATPEPVEEPTPMINTKDLSPDQILELSATLAELAKKKQKELDPELLRQMLEAGEQVCAASDMLVEATERLRRMMTQVRKATGLPTHK